MSIGQPSHLAATRRSNKSLCVNWRILVKIFVSATEFCRSNVSQKIKSDRICATCFAPTYCCKLSPNVFRPWGSELAEKGAEERFLSGSYVSYMLADPTIPKDCWQSKKRHFDIPKLSSKVYWLTVELSTIYYCLHSAKENNNNNNNNLKIYNAPFPCKYGQKKTER